MGNQERLTYLLVQLCTRNNTGELGRNPACSSAPYALWGPYHRTSKKPLLQHTPYWPSGGNPEKGLLWELCLYTHCGTAPISGHLQLPPAWKHCSGPGSSSSPGTRESEEEWTATKETCNVKNPGKMRRRWSAEVTGKQAAIQFLHLCKEIPH